MIIINKNTRKIYYRIFCNHDLTLDEALDFIAPATWREQVNAYGYFHDLDDDIYYDELDISQFDDGSYTVRDRETGTVLEINLSLKQAKEIISLYEAEDKMAGEYEEDYYEIYDPVMGVVIDG